MAGCGCSIANLGYGSCGEVFDVTRKLIFVRTYDNDGVRNKISTSDLVDGVLPEAFITAKLIATPDKRWYPIGDFNAVVEATGEDVEFTDDFGANFPISKGSITYEGYIEGAGNKLESKVNGYNCDEFSVYQVDLMDTILGDEDGEDLYPLAIVKGTIKATYFKKSISGATPNRLLVNYTLKNNVRFGSFAGIPQDENGYDMSGLNGLQDATSAVEVVDATTLKVTITTDGGSFAKPRLVTGLVIGDFAILNTTTAGAVVPSVLAEVAGVYTLTIPAQTTSDSGVISAVKGGFEIAQSLFTFA